MTSEVGELDIDHGQTATGSAICVVLLDHYFCLSHAGRQPVKMGFCGFMFVLVGIHTVNFVHVYIYIYSIYTNV